MAFGNRILTTTQDKMAPVLVDTVLNSNVFAGKMLKAAKPWRGEKMKFPVKVTKNTTGGSFAGFDSLSTSSTNNRVNMEFSPKNYSIAVALPFDELSVNATAEKVIDLASVEVQSAALDMADDIGTLFWSDGTGNGGKDFLGLGAIVDDGSTVATIGGLSRSTYPTLAGTVTSSSGTLSLAKMRTLYNAISSGSVRPTSAYCTEAVFGFYEALLQPQEHIMKTDTVMKNGMVGGTGFSTLFYQGIPIFADEKATSGSFVFLNEDFIDWYALPFANTKPIQYKAQIDGVDTSSVMGLGFSWSDWIIPSNQAAVVGHVYLAGELVTTDPKRHGKLTAITGV